MFACSVSALAQVPVRYPSPETDNDHRDDYTVELLHLALAKAGGQFVAVPSTERWSQARTLVHLAEGVDVDVGWSMTSLARERDLLPVRVQIFKGLIGWRVALVRRDRPDVLKSARRLQDLGSLVAGQGHDWPDTEILRANGLNVVESTSYDSLFRMLVGGRFDYFPRSLVEISIEQQANKDTLAIDPYVLLHYPAAAYFFVRKGNTELADAIHRGLGIATADGSFDALFNRHFGEQLARLNVEHRRVIELTNPLLPPGTPLNRARPWATARKP